MLASLPSIIPGIGQGRSVRLSPASPPSPPAGTCSFWQWTSPARRRGHPVIFTPVLRDELLRLEEATQGLRAVLARHACAVQVVETGTPLALLNLNTPEDYEAGRRLAGLE
jgi:molybdopterin-guanine dinucleotide biosynthesis protein A